MKRIILIAGLFYFVNVSAQIIKKPNLGIGKDKKENVEVATESKAQGNIDQAKNCIKNLEEKAAEPNWSSSSYVRSYNTQLESLADHIAKIKNKDPKYKVSDLEESYAKYKKLRDDGEKVVNEKFDAKVKKEEEDKKNAQLAKEAEKHQKVKDEGITNATHQKYLQKIVFSSSEISKTSPNESAFATEFNINSSIFFRAYFKESIYNSLAPNYNTYMLERDGGLHCKIYIDGSLAYDNGVLNKRGDNYYIPLETKKILTSIDGAFDLKLDKLGSEEFFSSLLAKESSLTPGKHKFKVEFYPKHLRSDKEESTLLAEGEFTLNVTKGFVNPKDYITCMPASKKTDAALEAKFMAAAKKAWNEDSGGKAEFKKIAIRSPEWIINKNEYTGKILSRTMYAAFGITENGKCSYIVLSFTQDYNGSGYQSDVRVFVSDERGEIFCDCIK